MSRTIPQRHQQAAFTLLELLVAVAIGALLLSVGVPSFTTVVRNSNQVGSVNEMISSMHLARELAITRNTRMTLCPSSDGERCDGIAWNEGWIVFEDSDSDGQVDADETVERVVDEIDVPSVVSIQFPDSVVFRPNGRAMGAAIANNTGEFTLCDERGSAYARVAIIDMSGRPRVSDKRMDGSAPVCPALG